MVVSSQPLGAALEQQVRRQEKDLAELIRIDADLNRRDAARLAAAGRLRDTALAKLDDDRRHYDPLWRVYGQKVPGSKHLARREVMAPLTQEVAAKEDRAIQLNRVIKSNKDEAELRIREQQAIDAWEAVKLAIDTETKRRFHNNDVRRTLKVTEARLTWSPPLESTAAHGLFSASPPHPWLRGQGRPSWSEFSRPHGASPRP